jgi:hypothetical protein
VDGSDEPVRLILLAQILVLRFRRPQEHNALHAPQLPGFRSPVALGPLAFVAGKALEEATIIAEVVFASAGSAEIAVLENIDAQHPRHKKQRDYRHDDVSQPLAGGFRVGSVGRGGRVAGFGGQSVPETAVIALSRAEMPVQSAAHLLSLHDLFIDSRM